MLMKIRFLILCCVLLFGFLASCKQDDVTISEFESTGLIIGPDLRFCACCGGWLIQVDQQENFYNFGELPENSDINLDGATFPIEVQLNWSKDTTITCENWIFVEDIILVE